MRAGTVARGSVCGFWTDLDTMGWALVIAVKRPDWAAC